MPYLLQPLLWGKPLKIKCIYLCGGCARLLAHPTTKISQLILVVGWDIVKINRLILVKNHDSHL